MSPASTARISSLAPLLISMLSASSLALTSGAASACLMSASILPTIDRRPRPRKRADPGGDVVARHARFIDRRHVRQPRRALERRHRQRAELARLHAGIGGGEVGKDELGVAGHYAGNRRRAAAKRDAG